MLHQTSWGSPENVKHKYVRCSNLIKSQSAEWDQGQPPIWAGSLESLFKVSWFHHKTQSPGGRKQLLVGWNSSVRACRAAATFLWGTDVRVPLLLSMVIRGGSPWRSACGFPCFATRRKRLNGLCSPKSSSWKGLTVLLLEITQKSSLLCRFLLCWHTKNSTGLCSMVQMFSKFKICFLIWGQRLVPSITAKRDSLHSPLTSRKLLVRKSIYSAWIMGTRAWLLITQARQLHRCYSIQYYSKVSIFISNKMLTF